MLKRILFVLFLAAQGAMFNPAWGADRDAQVKELMKALQFDSILKETQEQTQKMLDDQRGKMLAQIKQAVPNLDEQATKELNAAVQEFTQRVASSWDPEKAARVYANALVEGMPDKELDAMIAHYRTPQAQRELKVISSAARSLNAYIMQSIQAAMEAAAGNYMSEVRGIMTRQKERWKTAPAAAKK